MQNSINILFFGDIVGIPGQTILQKWTPKLKEKYNADFVIVNGENAAKNGKGITPKIMEFFKHTGVDLVTSGNHIWQNRDLFNYLNSNSDLLRPENFPPVCPGKGHTFINNGDITLAVLNLQGRVFMRENLDCPFRVAESVLTYLKSKTNIILVDFHAEATSEKRALAEFLDGKVSVVIGTHTHVQTADEQILFNGTGFITDVGFCGSKISVLGVEKEAIIGKFINQMPAKFSISGKSPFVINAVSIKIDKSSGKTISIERINILDTQIPDII